MQNTELPYLGVRYQIKYHRCNLECPYCIAQWKKVKELPFDLVTFQSVLTRLRELPYRVSLRIGVGGEVFTSSEILNEIVKLCNEKNNIFGLSFSTNLEASWDKYIAPFLDSVDTTKLGLGCTLHDTVIKDVDGFFSKVQKLHDRGISLYVGYVAIPQRLHEIKLYKKRCDEIGVPLTMNGIHGQVDGVDGVDSELVYPEAYTNEECAEFKELWDTPHNYMMEVSQASPKGMTCSAGKNYIYINLNGDVSPCGKLQHIQGIILGNILRDPINLQNEDTICPQDVCDCGNENQALRIVDQYYERSHVLRIYRPRDEYSSEELYSLYQSRG